MADFKSLPDIANAEDISLSDIYSEGSFSTSAIKAACCAIHVKRLCCRKALICGLRLLGNTLTESFADELDTSLSKCLSGYDNYTPMNIPEFGCLECERVFLRGVFISSGNLSDPLRTYHLELKTPSYEMSDLVEDTLTNAGLPPKRLVRNKTISLYYKESAAIADFLMLIGAQEASFKFMNTVIFKQKRNNANREANCDAANIEKTVKAAGGQIDAIEALAADGTLSQLSDDLIATAELRLIYPHIALDELAALHDPPITKSGVYHRLRKLVNMYNKQYGHG